MILFPCFRVSTFWFLFFRSSVVCLRLVSSWRNRSNLETKNEKILNFDKKNLSEDVKSDAETKIEKQALKRQMGVGQHSTIVSLLASGPSCSGFDSHHSQFFSEEKVLMSLRLITGAAQSKMCTVPWKCWSSTSGTGYNTKKQKLIHHRWCLAERIKASERLQHARGAVEEYSMALLLREGSFINQTLETLLFKLE